MSEINRVFVCGEEPCVVTSAELSTNYVTLRQILESSDWSHNFQLKGGFKRARVVIRIENPIEEAIILSEVNDGHPVFWVVRLCISKRSDLLRSLTKLGEYLELCRFTAFAVFLEVLERVELHRARHSDELAEIKAFWLKVVEIWTLRETRSIQVTCLQKHPIYLNFFWPVFISTLAN